MAGQFSELDFNTLKKNLRDYLKGQSTFKDYNFAGSNIDVLLDVLAYNTMYNNIYTNMAFSEMFLDSAQLRDSVVSRAKELNYTPRSTTSPFAVVQVEVLNVTGNPAFLTLPKYSKFTGKGGNATYEFVTDETYAIDASSGSYCSGNIPIYEGVIAREAFQVKEAGQRFILENADVDTTSIDVYVRKTVSKNSDKTEYNKRDNLFGVDSDDPVFYVNEADKGRYEITFGQNVFGLQPKIGNVIEVTYRVSKGTAANGIKTFTLNNRVEGYATKVTTMARATGGAARETVSAIKYFAPKSIQVQDRAVVAEDYKILLKNKFPEITAIAVYGGEELNPPQFGRTVISLAVNDMDGFSENVRNRCLEFLNERCVLAIGPIIKSPEYMYVSVGTTVKYNRAKTARGAGYVKNNVTTAIQSFSKNQLNDFGDTLYLSQLTTIIDDSFDFNISNETKIRAIIPLIPSLTSQNKYEIYFQNALAPNRKVVAGDDISDYMPCVKTTAFQIAGRTGYIMDDGTGVLHFVRNVNNTFTYLNKSVGSVNYNTGKISLNKANITAFTGSGIEFSASPKYSDVKSPKSRILKIRDTDIDVTATGVHVG